MVAEVADAVTEQTELTVGKAAVLAGVSDRTIRNWINAGELPARSEPGGRKIRKGILLDLLAEKGYAPPILDTPELLVEAVVAAMASPTDRAEGAVAPESASTEGSASAEATATMVTPEMINVILQPLVDQLKEECARTERLHRENLELAGRIGFLQAKLMETERKLLLEPAEPVEMAAPENLAAIVDHRAWWKKLFARS